MPIYDFECTNSKCNKKFEKVCRSRYVSDDKCPDCGCYSKKVISVVNFKCNKFEHKPLNKSKPKSYVPTLHDLGLDKDSKKKQKKEFGGSIVK